MTALTAKERLTQTVSVQAKLDIVVVCDVCGDAMIATPSQDRDGRVVMTAEPCLCADSITVATFEEN